MRRTGGWTSGAQSRRTALVLWIGAVLGRSGTSVSRFSAFLLYSRVRVRAHTCLACNHNDRAFTLARLRQSGVGPRKMLPLRSAWPGGTGSRGMVAVGASLGIQRAR